MTPFRYDTTPQARNPNSRKTAPARQKRGKSASEDRKPSQKPDKKNRGMWERDSPNVGPALGPGPPSGSAHYALARSQPHQAALNAADRLAPALLRPDSELIPACFRAPPSRWSMVRGMMACPFIGRGACQAGLTCQPDIRPRTAYLGLSGWVLAVGVDLHKAGDQPEIGRTGPGDRLRREYKIERKHYRAVISITCDTVHIKI